MESFLMLNNTQQILLLNSIKQIPWFIRRGKNQPFVIAKNPHSSSWQLPLQMLVSRKSLKKDHWEVSHQLARNHCRPWELCRLVEVSTKGLRNSHAFYASILMRKQPDNDSHQQLNVSLPLTLQRIPIKEQTSYWYDIQLYNSCYDLRYSFPLIFVQ